MSDPGIIEHQIAAPLTLSAAGDLAARASSAPLTIDEDATLAIDVLGDRIDRYGDAAMRRCGDAAIATGTDTVVGVVESADDAVVFTP